MGDPGAASTAEIRRDPVQLRIERDTRLVLRGLGCGVAALGLLVVWFAYVVVALVGGPDFSPVVAYGIAAAIGSAILAACVLRRKPSVSRLITLVALIGLYLGLLARAGTVDDEPKVMRFYAAYRAVQTGMNAAEVRAAVDAQYPDRKPPVRFHPGGCFVGPLDPDDGRYNSEFFEVTFRNGVVASKSYLPD